MNERRQSWDEADYTSWIIGFIILFGLVMGLLVWNPGARGRPGAVPARRPPRMGDRARRLPRRQASPTPCR